ncbi:MAG: hypothetical protein K8R35_11350 [Bacteroidales bacterium]|nr:hypothetical protein [Bacteroidales bacterium]
MTLHLLSVLILSVTIWGLLFNVIFKCETDGRSEKWHSFYDDCRIQSTGRGRKVWSRESESGRNGE